MSAADLEERVSRIEQRLSELERLSAHPEPVKDWESTIGMFANRASFKEIVRLGREYREQQRKKRSSR